MSPEIRHIIESLLFVSEAPLSVQRMAEILETEDTAGVREAVKALSADYERRGGGFYLAEVAGGFQLRTRPEHREWIQRMLQSGPARLSKAAMETLAVIAYRQPVLRSDVEHIRGVDCGGVLRALLERKLIKILGRKEMPGRPLLYGTTRKFLEMFGLRDLKDLPTPKEFSPETSGTASPPPEQADLPFSAAEGTSPRAAGDAARVPPREETHDGSVHSPASDDTDAETTVDANHLEEAPPDYLPMVIEEAPDPTDDDPESLPGTPGTTPPESRSTGPDGDAPPEKNT